MNRLFFIFVLIVTSNGTTHTEVIGMNNDLFIIKPSFDIGDIY